MACRLDKSSFRSERVQALPEQRSRSMEEGHKNDLWLFQIGVGGNKKKPNMEAGLTVGVCVMLDKNVDKTSKWENLVALPFSISDTRGFYTLHVFSELILAMLVNGKQSFCWLQRWARWAEWALCQGAARADCSERESKLKGRASWKLSHNKAGRGSGLADKGTVPQYLSRKIRAGQDEDLDQQGTWPGMGTAALAQAGIKGENLSWEKLAGIPCWGFSKPDTCII